MQRVKKGRREVKSTPPPKRLVRSFRPITLLGNNPLYCNASSLFSKSFQPYPPVIIDDHSEFIKASCRKDEVHGFPG